jgi:hypothetical protein
MRRIIMSNRLWLHDPMWQPQRLPNPHVVVAHDGESGCQLIMGEASNRSALLLLNRGPFLK